MLTRKVLLFALVAAAPKVVAGQVVDSTSVLGIQPPSQIASSAFRDEGSLRLFNSLRVLSEGMAAHGQLRVLSLWGPHSRLDCGCLTSNLIIAFNLDGDELSAFRLGPLLDPVVDSLATERDVPVVYLTYGLSSARRSMRVDVLADRLAITEVALRPSVQPRHNEGW